MTNFQMSRSWNPDQNMKINQCQRHQLNVRALTHLKLTQAVIATIDENELKI